MWAHRWSDDLRHASRTNRGVAAAYDAGNHLFRYGANLWRLRLEENLGRALVAAGIRPQIATKVAIGDRRSGGHPRRRTQVGRGQPAATTRGGRHHVQVHNRVGSVRAARADLGVGAQLTPADVLGPVRETLRDLREEGKTRAIGCCAWGGEYAAVCEVLNSGAFDTVLVGYSLLNPTSGRSAPAGFQWSRLRQCHAGCRGQWTSAVVLKVLESGSLAGLAAAPDLRQARRRPGNSATTRTCTCPGFLDREGQTLTQAAVRFALGNPHVNACWLDFPRSIRLMKRQRVHGERTVAERSWPAHRGALSHRFRTPASSRLMTGTHLCSTRKTNQLVVASVRARRWAS